MLGWLLRKTHAPCAGGTAGEWSGWYRIAFRNDPEELPALRGEVAAALTPLGYAGQSALSHASVMAILVAHANESFRCVAAIHLAAEKEPASEAALIAALQDPSEAVRRAAAMALVENGSPAG